MTISYLKWMIFTQRKKSRLKHEPVPQKNQRLVLDNDW